MLLQYFEPTNSADDISTAVARDGAAVVRELVPKALVDQITSDLREDFDKHGYRSRRDFSGHKTSRCHFVLRESPASATLIAHDVVLAVIDAILLPHCESYRIGSITAIEVNPGERDQNLHRDDSMYPVHIPGLQTVVSCMWALTDFSQENGATRVVPCSHRHVGRGMDVDLANCQQAVMPKGSVLFYLGSTWHGAGANTSKQSRVGLVNTYSLGWLRQEVNQYLNVPFDIARTYDSRMRRLLGYTTHDKQGDRLGKYYGDDTAFEDKDNYARHYRPWPRERGAKG